MLIHHAELQSEDPDAGIPWVKMTTEMMKAFPGMTPRTINDEMTMPQVLVLHYP